MVHCLVINKSCTFMVDMNMYIDSINIVYRLLYIYIADYVA